MINLNIKKKRKEKVIKLRRHNIIATWFQMDTNKVTNIKYVIYVRNVLNHLRK